VKKYLVCKSCNTENPLYAYTCKECNAFLRSKISNIDFWEIISLLLESPVIAAEKIIQSDHKNYVIVLSIIAGLKISINGWVINNALSLSNILSKNILLSVILGLCSFLIGIIFISLLAIFISRSLYIQTRFKDFYSIYIYSFVPIIALFFVLTPVQIALFGTYWFTFNPSPFIIKNLPSYVIVVIEGLFFFWSFILTVAANYTQIRRFIASLLLTIIEWIILGIIIISGQYFLHIAS
jgi:hypothetical protein